MKLCPATPARRPRVFAWLAIAAFSPALCQATVTVTPVNGGDRVSDTEKNIYYGALTVTDQTLNSAPFDGDGDRYFPVDITKTQDLEDSIEHPNRLYFDVTSTASKKDGKQLLLIVKMAGDSGERAIPISSVGDGNVPCDSTRCQDVHTEFSQTRFFAVRYTPGERMRIGIYPAEACWSYDAESSEGSGCTGSEVTSPVAGSSGGTSELNLTFAFASAEDTGPATGNVQESASVSLHFQVDRPTFVCPDLREIYTPGDSEILLRTTGFSVASYGSNLLLSGRAPAVQVIVLGNEAKDPDLSEDFATRNTIYTRLALGGEYPVGGFTNATAAGEHLHNVTFMVRDAAGMLAVPSAGACQLSGVQTSGIDSFLKKGNCFIATAAFRSTDAAPVELLRHFRDRILLRFGPGKAFVRAYYRHSPAAAEWLLGNPVFRGPVLVALTPIEAAAWLLLHPLWFGALLVVSALGALGTMHFAGAGGTARKEST